MSSGDLFGSDDSEAQGYLQQALSQYNQASVPTISQGTVNNLPQESVQGTVNPNQIQTATQAPSAYGNISLDPSTRQAQINALNSYQNIANSGGLDANAQLGLQQTINAANTQSQGAQGAIMNSAQAEGQGGGDFALTQRALAAQGASNNAATQGLQSAAEAETNRENALNQMSNIGNQVESSDYGQAATAAGAQNTINAANQQAQNAANTGNVANNLTAQTTNLQNSQNVNAANTTANQGQVYYNAALPQQHFNNEMQKASGMAGVNQAQAGVAQQSQANSANATGQLLKGGVALGATALGGPLAGAAASGALQGSAPPASANTQQYAPQGTGQSLNYADGGMVNKYISMLLGGHVPGKAVAPGDTEENDTVPAMLSPGEIVVKRSKAENPEEAAKEAKKISLEHFAKGYKRGK